MRPKPWRRTVLLTSRLPCATRRSGPAGRPRASWAGSAGTLGVQVQHEGALVGVPVDLHRFPPLVQRAEGGVNKRTRDASVAVARTHPPHYLHHLLREGEALAEGG